MGDLARDLAGLLSFGLLAVFALAVFKLAALSPLGAKVPGLTDLAAFV